MVFTMYLTSDTSEDRDFVEQIMLYTFGIRLAHFKLGPDEHCFAIKMALEIV